MPNSESTPAGRTVCPKCQNSVGVRITESGDLLMPVRLES